MAHVNFAEELVILTRLFSPPLFFRPPRTWAFSYFSGSRYYTGLYLTQAFFQLFLRLGASLQGRCSRLRASHGAA